MWGQSTNREFSKGDARIDSMGKRLAKKGGKRHIYGASPGKARDVQLTVFT